MASRVPLQVSGDVVVASIQVDLDDAVLRRFQQDLLARIHASAARGVLLDVSALETLDADELTALRRIMDMGRVLGARSVLVGLRPGVVSALIDTDADVDGLEAAASLDDGFQLLAPPALESPPEPEPEEEEEPGEDTDPEEASRGT